MNWTRRAPIGVIVIALAGALVYGFWPVATRVDAVRAERGTITVTVDEDGKTRVREKYTVSAPVYGKLFRIELDEGDRVVAGETVLLSIEPSDPSLLDARAKAEATARVRATEAAVQQMQASLQRAKEVAELAGHDYQRARTLVQQRTMSLSEFDEVEHRERMAQAELRSSEFALAVANFELEQAQAALIRSQEPTGEPVQDVTLSLTSPVNGQVLRVLQENAGVVSPGTPLLEIGDLRDMEMEIDVLSNDAVNIRLGAKVIVEQWGGPIPLEGQVRLVEPAAFLKISALGVEEQRVNVIADFTSPLEQRKTLGDGYRMEARIEVDRATDVIKIPAGTLFRVNDGWHVFLIVHGRAKLQPVETGKTSGLETEIVQGVGEGDLMILHPTDEIVDGKRVRFE